MVHLVQQAVKGMYTYIHTHANARAHNHRQEILEVWTLTFRFRPFMITHFNIILSTFHNWFRWSGTRPRTDELAYPTTLLFHKSFSAQSSCLSLWDLFLVYLMEWYCYHLMYFMLPKSVFAYGGGGGQKNLNIILDDLTKVQWWHFIQTVLPLFTNHQIWTAKILLHCTYPFW